MLLEYLYTYLTSARGQKAQRRTARTIRRKLNFMPWIQKVSRPRLKCRDFLPNTHSMCTRAAGSFVSAPAQKLRRLAGQQVLPRHDVSYLSGHQNLRR